MRATELSKALPTNQYTIYKKTNTLIRKHRPMRGVNPATTRSGIRRRTLLEALGGASLVSLAGPAAAEAGTSLASIDVGSLRLEVLGRYESGRFDEGGAEIVDYHVPTSQLFVINAELGGVDILDVADPTAPTKVGDIDVAGDLDGMSTANSVSVGDDIVAVAIEAETPQDPGRVGLYDPETFELRGSAAVGALPDKVTLTPDGQRALVANEGEPNAAYDVDPHGSVSIVDLTDGPANPTVQTASFTQYDGQEDELRERGIRVFGPGASAAQDFEPEYVTISDDSTTAWVSLQENNAIAEIDIAAGDVVALWPLGFTDHREPGNALDASNEDGGENIRSWPIYGMLQPDAIGAYSVGGETYLVTANEGDARDYEGFSEEAEIGELDLDPEGFEFDDIADIDGIDELQQPEHLGVKGVTTTRGDTDDDGRYEELYVYGGRSVSIFDSSGSLVFDSGDELERLTAERYPEQFNNDNDESDPDGRSDNKGPEPEGLTIGTIGNRTYAFVGLERVGGIVTYDITDPTSPTLLDYVNDRDFSVDIEADIEAGDAPASAAGDLGPEGLAFATAEESPTDEPLLFVGHEISGTTTVFAVRSDATDGGGETASDGDDAENGGDTGESTDDTTGSETAGESSDNTGSSMTESTPGFGIASAIASLGGAGYLLKRRFDDER